MGAGESGKWYLGPLKSGTPVELKTNITAVTGVWRIKDDSLWGNTLF